MRSFGRFILLALLAGCASDSGGPVDITVHGRYTLRTLDDQSLPAVFADQPNLRVEFMRGVVTLNQDMSFTDSTEIRRTENQLVRRIIDVAAGTYLYSDDLVTLSSTRGERYTMTVTGGSLTQDLSGILLVYRK